MRGCRSVSRRVAVIGGVAVALAATLAACGTSRTALADDELVAVCITGGGGRPIRTELCSVDLSGQRRMLGVHPDEATSIALSPDRERIAFVVHGRLHLVDVDGTDDVNLDTTGRAPEWLDDDTLAYVTANDGEIATLTPGDAGRPLLVRSEQLPPGGDWYIDGFAQEPGGERMVLSLRELHRTPDDLNDDQFGLARLDSANGTSVLVGALSQHNRSAPDFAPDGRLVVATDSGVALLDVEDGSLGRLDQPGDVVATPAFSADGRRLIWFGDHSTDPTARSTVWVAELRGSQLGAPQVILDAPSDVPFDRFPVFLDW